MAKRIDISIPHSGDTEDARARMEALGDYFKNRHGMSCEWTGPMSGRLSGRYTVVSIDANIHIRASDVYLDAKDPGMLMRKKAKDYLDRKVRSYLDPSVAVEALQRR